VKISNSQLEIVCLAETGPRIVGLFVAGIEGNLLAETPNISEETPYGPVALLGGHRLWEAPELAGVSGLPDSPVQAEIRDAGIQLLAEPNAIGLQKTIEVKLAEKAKTVHLVHTISNQSQTTFQLAPWAITQLPPGGHLFAPLPTVPASQSKMPNRNLVLWPYSSWRENGIRFSSDGLHFNPTRASAPFKFGTLVQAGWASVEYENYTFSKRFGADPSRHYPDRGCNLEVYLGDDYLEVESLAPLAQLEPGGKLVHTEIWEIERKSKPPD
jgi:hypothetical protein